MDASALRNSRELNGRQNYLGSLRGRVLQGGISIPELGRISSSRVGGFLKLASELRQTDRQIKHTHTHIHLFSSL